MYSGVVGFAVDPPGQGPALAVSIEKGHSLETRGRLDLQEGRDRGHDVDQPDGLRHARSRVAREGKLQEKGDVEGLAIEQDPVLLLAMVPQPLPMVGDEEDDRAVVDA